MDVVVIIGRGRAEAASSEHVCSIHKAFFGKTNDCAILDLCRNNHCTLWQIDQPGNDLESSPLQMRLVFVIVAEKIMQDALPKVGRPCRSLAMGATKTGPMGPKDDG